MKEKIITAFQDNHRDLLISKKTGQFEDVLYNTGYETALEFVLGLMGISKEEALNIKEIKEEIKVKNVRENQLKKCIFMEVDVFTKLIEEISDGLSTVEYEDGVYITHSQKAADMDVWWNEDILETLSKYFDVNVTSFHSDSCEYVGVWICYKE